MRKLIPFFLSATLILSACGDSTIERVGSGAVIGGATGLAIGGVCCQNPPKTIPIGFFVGVIVGAVVGLVVDHPLFFNTHPNN